MSDLSHRSHQTVLGALIAALVMVVLPAAAGAQPDGHGVPAAPVNAPGTDVAAPDQQAPRVVINAPGTDVAAPDQQAPRATRGSSHYQADRTAPVSPAPRVDATGPIDDSGPTITLPALIALALGLTGVGFASWLAVSRKRGRAAV
jgi:hypothetical protein